MNDQLKGHLLRRQSGLGNTTRNIIVCAADGNYDISKISSALRQAFRNDNPSNSRHYNSYGRRGRERGRRGRDGSGCLNGNRDVPWKSPNRSNDSGRCHSVFFSNRYECSLCYTRNANNSSVQYTYNTAHSHDLPGAIIDTGERSCVVGKDKLDMTMKQLGLRNIADSQIKQSKHRLAILPKKFQLFVGFCFLSRIVSRKVRIVHSKYTLILSQARFHSYWMAIPP